MLHNKRAVWGDLRCPFCIGAGPFRGNALCPPSHAGHIPDVSCRGNRGGHIMTSVPLPVRFGWYACRFAVSMVEMQFRVTHAVTMALLSAGKPRAQAATPALTPAAAAADVAEPAIQPGTVAVVASPSGARKSRAAPVAASVATEPPATKRPRRPSMPPPLPAARGLTGETM